MRTIVIGDVHGRAHWKQVVDQDFDECIFLGDYVDTHENITAIEQRDNLDDIIVFKQEHIEKVHLLIGNHDFHYWPGITETCSGYQPAAKAFFNHYFDWHSDLFKMVHVDNNGILYSHAGVTCQFLDSLRARIVPDHINGAFKVYPQIFGYYPSDNSGYGDHPMQSNIWVRPKALKNWKYEMTQVVGHTGQQGINIENGKRDNVFFIDTVGGNEFLIIEDGEFKVHIIAK